MLGTCKEIEVSKDATTTLDGAGDREALDAILARGAAQARERAVPTLDPAYRALGLVRG